MSNCIECGAGPLGPKNKSGLCRPCCTRKTGLARRKPKQHCKGCGKELVKSRTGRCVPCFNAHMNSDPEVSARRKAGMKKWAAANPLALKLRAKRGAITRNKDPEYLERLRETVRTKVQPLTYTKEALARRDYKARGEAISRAKLPWCPPEYRQAYRDLCRKGIPASEARAAIEQEIALAQERLTPFERQMRALERGATLIANDDRPSLARPGVYSSEMVG